jgi:DNA polymerase-4
MRDLGWQASTVNIKLRYSDFQTLTRMKAIKSTDDDKIIFNTAWSLLTKAYIRRVAVRLIGVRLTNFSPYSEQEYLFEDLEIKRKKMLRAITRIRDKYGYEIIGFSGA